MHKESFRRVFDTMVKNSGLDRLSVEVFLSDNGMPLILSVDYFFSERRINRAFWETPMDKGTGAFRMIREDLPELREMGVKAGFVEKAWEAIKHRYRSKSLLDALIESARMLAQVGMLSPEQLEEMDVTDTLAWKRLDLSIWPELADGCLPYTKEMEPQIKALEIFPVGRMDLYAPGHGQICRFRRDKIIDCQLKDEAHNLSAYLSDDVHELGIRITVSSKGHKVKTIQSQCIRSPYPGVCNLPFPRVSELAGVFIDADFKRRVLKTLGGKQGCIHLTDLVLDVVRYYQDLL